jgi:hypothetical protein
LVMRPRYGKTTSQRSEAQRLLPIRAKATSLDALGAIFTGI